MSFIYRENSTKKAKLGKINNNNIKKNNTKVTTVCSTLQYKHKIIYT